MRIPEEVINDIRKKARIEDIIGSFITVMKKGNNYNAYCPFHDDHNPSLQISTDKQIFKCFSCPAEEGSAGDVFRFVSKYKHCEYPEAVKIVAEMIGYKYDFGTSNVKVFEETVYHKILRDSVTFCQHELSSKDGVAFKEYLNKRNITDEIIEKFSIGYNPLEDKLYNFLHKKGYSDEDVIKANVARLTQNGIRDVFYNRIMIPIFDIDNHPIGFTARTIDKNVDSKYINSTDTPIFNKSTAVFNLNRAKQSAKEKKYIIMAEGPMDVIAFERAGITNCICTLGTATTKQQLETIKRVTNRLMLAFDGDKAGQGAILRTGKIAVDAGFKVVVINNTTELDPDEIINKYGSEKLIEMVKKPLTWIEFVMQHYSKEYDLNNYSEKKEFAMKVIAEINKLDEAFDRENWINVLKQKTGFSFDAISTITENHKKEVIQQEPVRISTMDSGFEIACKTIIKMMLLSKRGNEVFKEQLGTISDETFDRIARKISEYYMHNSEMDVAELCADDPDADLIYEISEKDLLGIEYNEDVINDAIIKLQVEKCKADLEKIRREMNSYTDPDLKIRRSKECQQIILKIRELNEKRSGSK